MSLVENLMSESISYAKEFKIDIVANRTTLVQGSLTVDSIVEKITIKAKNTPLNVYLDFSDLIGIVSEEDLDTSVVHNIKLSLRKMYEDDYLKNLVFVIINYYPFFQYKSFNFKGALCCKCTNDETIRMKKSFEILISKNAFNEAKREFYQTKLFNELNPHVKRKMIVFVNPISGTGNSARVWEQVKEIFVLANIDIELILTQHRNHAYEIVYGLDKTKYNGVVTCSGDGIMHEIINAIMNRQDKDDFLQKVPVGCLPGGTSNALSEVVRVESREQRYPEVNAFIIAKGDTKDIDVQEIELLSEKKKLYSFLSVTWSIISDVDLDSDYLRCLGTFRFTLYGIIRCCFLRKYYGSFYYLPIENENKISLDDIPPLNQPLDENIFNKINDQFNLFLAGNMAYIGEDMKCLPNAKLDNGYCDFQFLRGSQSGRWKLINHLAFHLEKGDFVDDNGFGINDIVDDYNKTKVWRLVPKLNLHDSDEVAFTQHFDSSYSIDGEKYPIGPIQVKTLNKAIKIFCSD